MYTSLLHTDNYVNSAKMTKYTGCSRINVTKFVLQLIMNYLS